MPCLYKIYLPFFKKKLDCIIFHIKTMKTNNRIARLAVNEEGFVFDPQTGESFTVNQTGKTILKALIESDPEETIAIQLTEQFDVSPQEAQADVRDFIHHLRAYQLI